MGDNQWYGLEAICRLRLVVPSQKAFGCKLDSKATAVALENIFIYFWPAISDVVVEQHQQWLK